MKNILLILLSSFALTPVYGQELFVDTASRDTSLFLGSVNINREKLKVFENGDIIFKEAVNLTQVGLLIGDEFTDRLFKHSLYFELTGDEPFWKATIYKDSLSIWSWDDDNWNYHKIRLYTSKEDTSPTFFANRWRMW